MKHVTDVRQRDLRNFTQHTQQYLIAIATVDHEILAKLTLKCLGKKSAGRPRKSRNKILEWNVRNKVVGQSVEGNDPCSSTWPCFVIISTEFTVLLQVTSKKKISSSYQEVLLTQERFLSSIFNQHSLIFQTRFVRARSSNRQCSKF